VYKKYSNDNCSIYATQLAYYGFLALFPLFLAAFAILTLLLSNDRHLAAEISSRGLSQIPIIGADLEHSSGVRELAHDGPIALFIAVLGLIWGSRGVAQAALSAMASIWNVPLVARPGTVPRTLKSLVLLVVLVVGAAVSGLPSLLSSSLPFSKTAAESISYLVSALVDIFVYWIGFMVVSPLKISFSKLLPGAIFGGMVWSVLQNLGGYLVRRDLTHSSVIYGSFGLVIGLIAWLSLVASTALYAAELNVVITRRLWPRALVQSNLTDADREVLALLAEEQKSHQDQEIIVRFPEASELGAAESSQH
jgi:YihY family inner membrane protein